MQLGGESGQYLKLNDGVTKCRIISESIPVWVAFNRAEKTSKKFLREVDAVEYNRTADKDSQAKRKFALWTIDRTDGVMKLAEFGVSIMKQIQTLALDEDYKFSDIPGFDIKIVREGQGMETTYTVTPSPMSALTSEEQLAVVDLQPVADFLKGQSNVVAEILRDEKGNVIPF